MHYFKGGFCLFVAGVMMTAVSEQAAGQTRPNFPYSALGIGEYDYHAQGMLSGMGYGVSAVRSNSYLNNANPASFSALQDKLVLGELSMTGNAATLQNDRTQARSSDFDISRFAVGLKANKFWGTSVGLLPVSTVDYQIVSPETTIGSGQTVNSTYEGNGGIHEFYWGNGIRIGRHLSLGAQLNYLFGSLNQTEKVGYDVSNPILSSTQQTFLRNLNFSYGLQFYTNLSDKLEMAVALQYMSKRDLQASYTLSVVSGNDTLSNQATQDKYFTIPDRYRGGIALTYAHKFTVDFDYIFDEWGKLSQKNKNVSLVNSTAYGLGIQWAPAGDETQYHYNILEQLMFEGGVNYNNSYLEISGKQVRDVSVTLGGGFYNRSRTVSLSMGLAIGEKEAPSSGLFTERYSNLYLNLVLRNIWFVRSKNY